MLFQCHRSLTFGVAVGVGIDITGTTGFGANLQAISADYINGIGVFAGVLFNGRIAGHGVVDGISFSSQICGGAALAACYTVSWDAEGDWEITVGLGAGVGARYEIITIGVTASNEERNDE